MLATAQIGIKKVARSSCSVSSGSIRPVRCTFSVVIAYIK